MTKLKPKLRFAPSPNGYMHLGHAYSALLNVEIAKASGGEFIIRMEDIDELRCTEEYQAACLKDLAKIGVVSEAQILYQSQRQMAYDAALRKLTELGLVYPCLATRGDIKRHYKNVKPQYDPDGALIYPDLYKNLSLTEQNAILHGNEPFTLRFNVEAAVELTRKMQINLDFLEIDLTQNNLARKEFNPLVWGDVVLARKDIGTSYHLSVVVDDAMQNVTHIVRGMDLFKATYIHRILQIVLNFPEVVYFHHKLILDESLHKLAKSQKSHPIREITNQTNGIDLILDLLEVENMRKLANRIVVIMCKKNDNK